MSVRTAPLRSIAFALAVAVAAPAFAQSAATSAIPNVGGGKAGGPANGERHAAMQACKADRQTYCADVEKGGGRVMACMREHADKLSPGCKDALVALRAQRQGK